VGQGIRGLESGCAVLKITFLKRPQETRLQIKEQLCRTVAQCCIGHHKLYK